MIKITGVHMFRHHQIFTSSQLQRDYKQVAKIIEKEAQALLITQKGKPPLVLLPADAFDKLMMANLTRLTDGDDFNSTGS